jgi:hypothetical protein
VLVVGCDNPPVGVRVHLRRLQISKHVQIGYWGSETAVARAGFCGAAKGGTTRVD